MIEIESELYIADNAKISVVVGGVFVCLSTRFGLGQHFLSLSSDEIEGYLFVCCILIYMTASCTNISFQRFYIANGTYSMSTALIKLSLLFQYLRMFERGLTRTLCIGMIVIISCWGIAYSIMAWFPCFPIQAYWDWSITNAKCYAYGSFF